jgi:hypothetical protein
MSAEQFARLTCDIARKARSKMVLVIMCQLHLAPSEVMRRTAQWSLRRGLAASRLKNLITISYGVMWDHNPAAASSPAMETISRSLRAALRYPGSPRRFIERLFPPAS